MPDILYKYRHTIAALLILCSICLTTNAQRIEYISEDGIESSLELPANSSSNNMDSVKSIILQTLKDYGYLYASVTTPGISDSLWVFNLTPGPQIFWGDVQRGSVSEQTWKLLKPETLTRGFFSQKRLEALYEKIIDICENEGYPFASVSLKNVTITDNRINASLNFDPGPAIKYGGITVDETIIKHKFLEHYLLINKDKNYTGLRLTVFLGRLKNFSFFG